MPVQVSYPGVYVQEVSSGVRTITGVSTSIAAVIGMTKRGRLRIPTRVQSFADYERTFGNDTVLSETTDQVRQFFLNGGQQAWITRLADGAQEASIELLDAGRNGKVLTVTAKDAGRDGNRIHVAVDYATSSPEATFNLTVFREIVTDAGRLETEITERFSNLSMNPHHGQFVEKVVSQQSTLVDVRRDVDDLTVPLFAGYSLSGLFIRQEGDVVIPPDNIIAIDGTAETITVASDRRLAYPDGVSIRVEGSAIPSNNNTFNVVSTEFDGANTILTTGGNLADDIPAPAGATVTAIPTVAADLNAIINAGNNRIEMSVDGGPFRTIVFPPLNPVGDPVDFTAWQAVLNAAFPGPGVTVSLTDPLATAPKFRYLQFRSANTNGGSVVIRQSLTNDLTVPLQLGIDQGGLEVDGYANQRPAPSGFFANLGDLSATDGPEVLANFANAEQGALTAWTLTDASGKAYSSVGQPISFPGAAGARMYNGAAFTDVTLAFAGSLRNVIENFAFLGRTIEGEANGTNGAWIATMQGHRLVLTPTFGSVDSDIKAALTSTNPGSPPTAYNIGADNQPFDSTPGPASVQANVRAYSLGTTGMGLYQQNGVPGIDGVFPKLIDYRNIFPVIDREVDLFNLMMLPRAFDQTDAIRQSVWGPASVFCQQKRAFLIIDPPSDLGAWSDVNEVTAITGGVKELRVGLVNDHAAVYWPRLVIPANGVTKTIDPSGSIAGVMARTDANRGVWKAPAGVEATIRGIRGVEYTMSDPGNGLINLQAVNAIRVFPNGIVSWGARTMDGFENSGNDDYKYVPVRRIALFIEESLFRGLKFAVFEPNDEPLWAQIRLAAGAFMNNLFRQGAFQGQKARDAYFVKVDAETTTQNDINLGIVNVVVGFAPLKPAEFVIITIQQIAGQVQT